MTRDARGFMWEGCRSGCTLPWGRGRHSEIGMDRKSGLQPEVRKCPRVFGSGWM